MSVLAVVVGKEVKRKIVKAAQQSQKKVEARHHLLRAIEEDDDAGKKIVITLIDLTNGKIRINRTIKLTNLK